MILFHQNNKMLPDNTQSKAMNKSMRDTQNLSPISLVKKSVTLEGKKKVEMKLTKKMNIQTLVENVKTLLHHYHRNGKIGYEKSILKILNNELQHYRVKLNQRFNYMMYLEPSIQYKSYSEIELEVIDEWKKNKLLYSFQLIWMDCILKNIFHNPEQFQQQLQSQKNFIGQLSYNVFAPYFSILTSKHYDILDRLSQETCIYIITSFSGWQKIYQEVILSLYTIDQKINFQFDIKLLELGSKVIDFKKSNSYQKTIQCIKKMCNEPKMIKKIKFIKEMRKSLEAEIIQHQQLNILKGQLKKIQIVEKDDFIGLTIYCIIKGNIINIQQSVQYFKILFGQNQSLVLSRWNADCYKADIEASIQHLLSHSLISPLIMKVAN